MQLPVPEHAPDHPANVELVFGVAVSVTVVPAAKLRQPEPHEVPVGEELTVPLPVPDVVMVRVGLTVTVRLNAAVTAWLEFIDTVQLPVPEHAPDHPANVEPVFGAAVSATTVPAAKLRQPEPHEVPAGDGLTVPLPVPDVVMVRVGLTVTVRLNAAVTAWLAFIVTVQLPVPEHAPDQPANVDPAFGVAISVTTVPAA